MIITRASKFKPAPVVRPSTQLGHVYKAGADVETDSAILRRGPPKNRLLCPTESA